MQFILDTSAVSCSLLDFKSVEDSAMVSEPPPSIADEGNAVAEKPVCGFLPNRKNQGRVPKKIHKAEREKRKRDHLNELFLELGHALEPERQNNGKACILGDATKLLRDLITQVESLRKENSALVTESHYVTVEKNELRDENTILVTEIEKLQNELGERMQSKPLLQSNTETAPTLPQQTSTTLPMQHPSIVGPVYIIPLHQELQHYNKADASVAPPQPPSNVSRPHARYPSPSDSWPLQLLSRHRSAAQEGQHSGSSSSMATNSGVEGFNEA